MFKASSFAGFFLLASQTAAITSCPDAVLSCDRNLGLRGSCCYEAPGGLIAQTQFWDFDADNSPPTSWTIHGLWPDHCKDFWLTSAPYDAHTCTGRLSPKGEVKYDQNC
ncbi:ribonuclease T2-like, partial [Tulasnella sp. 418]